MGAAAGDKLVRISLAAKFVMVGLVPTIQLSARSAYKALGLREWLAAGRLIWNFV